MGWFWRTRTPAGVEARSVTVTQSAPDFFERLGIANWALAASDVVVTTDTALGVPAIWSAVNFISGTLAGLPLNLFRRTQSGKERVTNGRLATILHDAVNEETSSFAWRKGLFEAVMTGGRGLTFIERDGRDEVMNLFPMNPAWVVIKREAGRTRYEYEEPGRRKRVFSATDVIDMLFMAKPDGVGHRGPVATNKDVIGLAIAATQFGSKFFQNGGVPPFAVTGNFQSGAAMMRAAEDLAEATRKAAKDKRQALVMPAGMEIKSIGVDAEKSQLVEMKRFLVEEVARIYSLPPTFLQDLTHGTFANTEQQDLHVTKHTLKRWVEAFEQELNLKLFGRREQRDIWVEMNMDGLLRGDFATRMSGYASAIQNGVLMPNEARDLENRPKAEGGDTLYIQGATVPLPVQSVAKPDEATTGDANGA